MKLKSWPRCTDWCPLKNTVIKELDDAPASYIIAAHKKIHRAVGINDEGILTIGKTSSLRSRLRQFTKSAGAADADVGGHMAGWRFSYHKMNQHFPYSKLQVCWRLFETSDQAADEEARLLAAYIKQHMEQPPLNYSASWRLLKAAS
jgi:hypothetical protein